MFCDNFCFIEIYHKKHRCHAFDLGSITSGIVAQENCKNTQIDNTIQRQSVQIQHNGAL